MRVEDVAFPRVYPCNIVHRRGTLKLALDYWRNVYQAYTEPPSLKPLFALNSASNPQITIQVSHVL